MFEGIVANHRAAYEVFLAVKQDCLFAHSDKVIVVASVTDIPHSVLGFLNRLCVDGFPYQGAFVDLPAPAGKHRN